VNNNNNNNNNLNINAVDSSNIVANFNTNNANQVNIMPTGRKKKRSVVEASSVALLALIRLALEADEEPSRACQVERICRRTGGAERKTSHSPGALQQIFWRIYGPADENSNNGCVWATQQCVLV